MIVGGASTLMRWSRALSFGKPVPLLWWLPQGERAVLAIVSTCFWGTTIAQALHTDAAGASVLTFYGLGLVYTACVLANVGGGARDSLTVYRLGKPRLKQQRALMQLYGIMLSMFGFNSIVFALYVYNGAGITTLDSICVGVAVVTIAVLVFRYSLAGVLREPIARAYLSIACKASPQTVLAILFVFQPISAGALSRWALGCLALLSALRFWPAWLALRRDTSSKHMRALLLGETANLASILLLCTAWLLAMLRD